MSVPLAGYTTLRLLRASTRTRVYVAERNRDHQRVLAKVFELGDESIEGRIEHEFRLLQSLELDAVVHPLGVERAGRAVVLLLDYIDGVNLSEAAGGQPLALERLLPWALRIVEILAQIHARRIVHRDIKPNNILIERGSGRIVFADFGLSALFGGDQRVHDPEQLAHSLPYVSPEQTGRTRRDVDLRSDLYSLGVVFYELLAGRPPFVSNSPLELIHAHLARRPEPLHELAPAVPEQLSAIVMKLLEKAPEHRYQSALGLHADLQRLADELAAGNAAPRFELASADQPQVLQLPHQLYGRARESALLADELATAIHDNSRRSVLISGAQGVGKSALIASIEAPLSSRGGYLAIAKFDEQTNDTPYAALIVALQGLLAQILSESDDELTRWRVHLLDALGSVAGVVAGLIPELNLVIGASAPVPELPPTESQIRLQVAFGRLLSALCEVAPLVLAIDDVHWADAASVELLAALMRDSDGPILLLLGCRSDLPDPAATRLLQLATELVDEGRACRRLELASLDDASVTAMLADVLGRRGDELGELAAWVARKTGNRPLLVRRLLLHLFEVGQLRRSGQAWAWDIDALTEIALPTDLLDVLTAKLAGLSAEQRAVLELGACVGERFEPVLLLLGLGDEAPVDARSLFADLHELERMGLLDAIGSEYRFAHAHLRGHVYAQIEPYRRKQIHTAIGRRLLGRAGGVQRLLEVPGDMLFRVVDQLHAGLDLDDDDDGRERRGQRELAALGTRAGEWALEGAAWGTARRYFQQAVELLGPGPLTDRLRFRARFGHAQTLHLDGQFELADAAFESILAGELSMLERAAVESRRLRVVMHSGQTVRAVKLGLEALRRCGVELPHGKTMVELGAALREQTSAFTLERLLALPIVSDERIVAIMQLLDGINLQVFSVDRLAFVHLITEHLRLVLEHGFHASVIGAFHHVGFALLGMSEFDEARRICELGIELPSARRIDVVGHLLVERGWMLHVGPCFRPFAEFAADIVGAHRRAIELGDRDDAGHKGAIGLVLQLEAGTHLSEVRANFESFHAAHERWGGANMLAVAGSVRWLVEQLTAEPLDAGKSGLMPCIAAWDDEETSWLIRYGAVINRVWALVLLGDHEQAWDEAERIAGDYETAVFGSWSAPRFATLDVIVVAEQLRTAEGPARERLLGRMQQRLDALEPWAVRGPDNFRACADIIAGELAAARGRPGQATRLFEHARKLAAEHGRAWVEGLACLRLAALAEAQDWPTMAEGALRGAHRVFERWGAWAVVRRIEARLGLHGSERLTAARGDGESSTVLSKATQLPSLDLAAVLDTIQTISEDLRLEEVITRVLDSAIASAGADRGVLLLMRDGELTVVAEGHDGKTTAFLDHSLPLASAREQLPTSVIHYVQRTGTAVVVDDLLADPRFCNDPYVVRAGVRSVLGMAIVKQNSQIGTLVLENRLHAGAFTDERLESSRILLAQAASALDNARLYAELARNEAQWRSLVDGAPDVIALLDEQGHIEFINHLEPFAIDPRTLIGELGDKLLEPRSAAAWRRALSEVVGTGERRELELCVAPDGVASRWYMTRLAAIRVDGRLRRVLSIGTDITAHKMLEAQLRQQQRVESIGTFAAGVAHEINNPIQGILNYAELIGNRADDPATVREFADEITIESQRVATIVRNLLVFARQEREYSFELVPVNTLIESTLSLIGTIVRKDDIRVDVVIDPRVTEVRCRPQQIQQIIMNLVTNARDALNERYAGYHDDKLIRISAEPFERGGEWLRITVEDHGAGIPERVRARIFDPFFTTKGRDQGTGLGLSVSHGIATEHGGELRVDSEVGVGTRFMLELPRG